MFGEDDPFSDFFHTFFGGRVDPEDAARRGRGARARASRHGRDVESEITLTLEEAAQGATRQLSLKGDGHARTIPVRIPAGVTDGSRVLVSGAASTHGGRAVRDLTCGSGLRLIPGSNARGATCIRAWAFR